MSSFTYDRIPFDERETQENSEEHELLLECNHCKQKFGQTKLRQHVSSCQNEEDGEELDHEWSTADCLTPTLSSPPLIPAGSDHSSTTRSRSTVDIISSAEPSTVVGEREDTAGMIRQPSSTLRVAAVTTGPPDQATRSRGPLNSASSDTIYPVPALPQLPPGTESNLEVTHSSVEDIVKYLEGAVDDDLPPNVINVSRYNLLKQAHKSFKKESFQDTARLSIRFSGEDGIDNAGLSREFMSIVMQEIADQSIFYGENSKDLILDFAAINNRTYYTTGRMMAYFLVHRGPAPCLMSDHLYQLLVNSARVVERLTVNDVKDPEVKENIMKIVQSSEGEYTDTISQLFDFIEMAGCGNLAFDIRKRPLLVKYLVRFFAVERLQPAIDQLNEGLRTLGVLEKMEKFPTLMSKVMTSSDEPSITAQMVIDMFDVDWSPSGSNRHRKEAITHVYFPDLLDNLEGEGKFEQLFAWATGMRKFPVLGFRVKPKLTFDHPEDMVEDELFRKGLPYVNTCGLILHIPVLENEEEFNQNMRSAISFRVFTTS